MEKVIGITYATAQQMNRGLTNLGQPEIEVGLMTSSQLVNHSTKNEIVLVVISTATYIQKEKLSERQTICTSTAVRTARTSRNNVT